MAIQQTFIRIPQVIILRQYRDEMAASCHNCTVYKPHMSECIVVFRPDAGSTQYPLSMYIYTMCSVFSIYYGKYTIQTFSRLVIIQTEIVLHRRENYCSSVKSYLICQHPVCLLRLSGFLPFSREYIEYICS